MTVEHPPCRRGTVATMLAIVTIVAVTAVAHVWTHLRVIEYGYRISSATRQRDKLSERNRRLHVELAVLKSPARVAKVAASEIDLRPAEPHQVRRIRLSPHVGPATRPGAKQRSRSPVAAPLRRLVQGGTVVAAGPVLIPQGEAGRRSQFADGTERPQ